ncbi:MAG: DUF4339 domain-containing protein [Proteobacteria bacterium]|nr:DUF4339 domain-containing protein [Pseudomonadota bacterium]MCP4920989.1 DUF4339 domain-containing protein [Pseudomonadota bacterium]
MSRWLVSQGDRQFAAQDLDELKSLASNGRLAATDMVQPPGAADWLYASEVPELKGLLGSQASGQDFDDDPLPQRSPLPLVALFLVLIGVGGAGAWYFANKLPEKGELDLIGENGLALTEVLVTEENAQLYAKPDGASVGTMLKDSSAAILGKRGEWYHLKSSTGTEGYARVDSVVPAYFFADKDTRQDYDPLYNPDKYVSVKNASWLQLDEQNRNLTIFQFMIHNQSKFEMADLVLVATIKDKTGKELEAVEIPIEGTIPRHEAVMVGTLSGEDARDLDQKRLLTTTLFTELANEDEELNLRWAEGVEVEMNTTGFTEANIDILEIRAVPNE